MHRLYRVQLTPEQRQQLRALISSGSPTSRTNQHARVLLKTDCAPGGPGWSDEQVALALEVSTRTVLRVRQTFVQAGLERALNRQKHHGSYPRKVDGRVEAHLVALVCSPPPPGHARWTLRLLSDRLVELVALDSLSHETVRRTLKKTNSSPG